MPHTYTNLVFHIVFGTHGRIRLIRPEIKAELYAYMGALIKEKGGVPMIINGVEDHVHILLELPPNSSLSDVLRFVKANSSRWMKERFGRPFAWQKGFGAFSVSRSVVPAISKYILEQEKHHRGRDFQTEFTLLLQKNGVQFDEEFLWR